MKVVDKRNKSYDCKLTTLCVGDTFVFDDELYMILDIKIGHVIAVSLRTGKQTNFVYDTLVTPVSIECNIVKNVEVIN